MEKFKYKKKDKSLVFWRFLLKYVIYYFYIWFFFLIDHINFILNNYKRLYIYRIFQYDFLVDLTKIMIIYPFCIIYNYIYISQLILILKLKNCLISTLILLYLSH